MLKQTKPTRIKTWDDFFNVLQRCAQRGVVPSITPKVEIVDTKVWQNRVRQQHHAEREKAGIECCIVKYDDDMLRKLIRRGLLPKDKKDDRDAVGEAVSKMWKQIVI
jgi:hypothetical protein